MLWTLLFVCLFSFFFLLLYTKLYTRTVNFILFYYSWSSCILGTSFFFILGAHTPTLHHSYITPHHPRTCNFFFFFFFLLYTKLYTRTVNFILLFLILLHIGSMFHIGSTYTHTASPHITLGHVIHSLHITTNIANNWNTTIHYRNPGGIEHEVSYK